MGEEEYENEEEQKKYEKSNMEGNIEMFEGIRVSKIYPENLLEKDIKIINEFYNSSKELKPFKLAHNNLRKMLNSLKNDYIQSKSYFIDKLYIYL